MSLADSGRSVYHGLLGAKIDPLSEIRNAGLLTTGSALFVKDPSDADYTTVKDQVGRDNFFDTIQDAINAARSDKNDYIFVAPKDDGGVWDLGTALDVNKDRVHLISLGYTASRHGYSNTIRGFGTAALDTEILNVTGNGVEIAGFRFLGTHGTSADGTIEAVAKISGSQVWIHDSVIESNVAAAASDGTLVSITADGFRADNVWFGDSVGVMNQIKVGDSTTRHEFVNCQFVMDAQATGDEFFLAGTGAGEYVLVRNSDFINVEAGTLPAAAVTGSVTVDNPWILSGNSYINVTAAGTDPGVFVSPVASGTAAEAYDPGIAIGTALNVAS